MRFLSLRRDAGDEAPAATRPRRWRRWTRRRIALAALGGAIVLLGALGVSAQRSGSFAVLRLALDERLVALSGAAGLTVANIEVEGRGRTGRAALLAAIDAVNGMPLLAFDPREAKRRLEAMTWVRSVSVERRFPDTIFIRLVERQPLALWQRGNSFVVVDREGKVIDGEKPESFADLIVLVGDDAPIRGAELLELLSTEPALLKRVSAAVRVGGRRWNIRLDKAIDVALPERDAASAWRRLAQLERSAGILERDILMVDLRLPDRLVVRTAAEPPKPPSKKSRQARKAT